MSKPHFPDAVNWAHGHEFNKRKPSTGEPKCGVCGLVWKKDKASPEINCPRQPLSAVNLEWVEKYT